MNSRGFPQLRLKLNFRFLVRGTNNAASKEGGAKYLARGLYVASRGPARTSARMSRCLAKASGLLHRSSGLIVCDQWATAAFMAEAV